jgi:Fe-S cluster assembly iron-binding protein IscA
MLQVTEDAAAAFKLIADHAQMDGETFRVERSPGSTDEDGGTLRVQPVASPQDGDIPAEAPGIDVYVAPDLADTLNDSVIDARMTSAGAELTLRTKE